MTEQTGEPNGNTHQQELIDHQIMSLNQDSLSTQAEFTENLAASIHRVGVTHEGISVSLNLGDEPDPPEEQDQTHILVTDHYHAKLQIFNKDSGKLETPDLTPEQQEGVDAYASRAGRSLVSRAHQIERSRASKNGWITYKELDSGSLEEILAISVIESSKAAQELETRLANAPGTATGENFSKLQKAKALAKCLDTAFNIYRTTQEDEEPETPE